MTTAQIEKRLTAVEEELAALKAALMSAPRRPDNWVEDMAGTFAGDPLFEEAVRLGRKWREAEPIRSPRAKQSSPRVKQTRRK
jgi:hypothetical protein